MHPLEESCIDADQSEIVGRSVFLWGRWLIVIEMPVPMSQDKSFHMRPRFEAHGDTATRLQRGYRVALYMSLQDFARAQPAFLTQNLHQPAGLISPSTSVQALGSWNREQLLHC
jgi:hypothetical protein